MPWFGSHLSIAGSMAGALREASRLGFDTVQVFTKNQRQWRVAPLRGEDAEEWTAEARRLGWSDRLVAHNSYLINPGSPDDALWEKSVTLQREEIERCERLGIPRLVSHPGAHTGSGEEAGLGRIVSAYARLLRETAGYHTVVCLENTVGSGSNLGGPFEHLAAIRSRLLDELGAEADRRVRFCFDTCHALAAGHDMRTAEAADAALDEFDRVCGLSHVAAVHLNDSKGALGSRLDRHEHIGEGHIGLEGFRAVVNRRELALTPMILETPKEDSPDGTPWDVVNLGRLKGLLRGSGESATGGNSAVPERRSTSTPRRATRASRGSSARTPGARGGGAGTKGRRAGPSAGG